MTSKKHISFPSIEQFRTVVTNINRHYNFIGLDENGDAKYDVTLPKPVLKFIGTVKLHGSNGSVCFNNHDGMWVQSRENIITPEKDNYGFAFFIESRKDVVTDLFKKIVERNNIDLNANTISIYGEWGGGSIQKGVGISNIEKSFFIFGVKISPIVDVSDIEAVRKNPAYWVDYTNLSNNDNRIFNVSDFKTYEIEIDFNTPQLSQNKLSELTLEVEEECPVAKAFFDSVMNENIAYEENGKIWFEKENEFTDKFKSGLIDTFKQLREENKLGVNFIKFNLIK